MIGLNVQKDLLVQMNYNGIVEHILVKKGFNVQNAVKSLCEVIIYQSILKHILVDKIMEIIIQIIQLLQRMFVLVMLYKFNFRWNNNSAFKYYDSYFHLKYYRPYSFAKSRPSLVVCSICYNCCLPSTSTSTYLPFILNINFYLLFLLYFCIKRNKISKYILYEFKNIFLLFF